MSNKEIIHADRAHSEIGASSASRWLNCPGSVKLSRGMKDSTSKAASEGTAAHECSEYCFENSVDASECIGMEFNGYKVDAEMAAHVQYYLDNMKQYTESDEYDIFIEERFQLKAIHKDMFGSNDFCAMGVTNGELVIADFKYGKGINVDAEENIQLVFYALGAYYDSNMIYDFKTVKLIVVQPRIEGEEWSEWTITVEELMEYETKLKEGVKKVYGKNPKTKSGSHCKFCKAKAICPSLKKETEELIHTKFDDAVDVPVEKTLPEVAGMTKTQISKVLNSASMIEDWLKAIKSHAHSLLEEGHEIEGFKLVKAKSNRKIRDNKAVIADFEMTFGDKLFKPKQLETMGKLEKLIGKKEFADYLFKPDAGTAMAKDSDKRPAIPSAKDLAESAFDDAEVTTIPDESYDSMDF